MPGELHHGLLAAVRASSRRGQARRGRWVLVLLALLSGVVPATGQVFESVGTRALGMGGAFVAVANDATAVYWNPAGIATGAFLSLMVDHTALETRAEASRPDGAGTDGIATFAGLSTNAVGLAYYRLRTNRVDPPPPAEPGSTEAPQLQSLILHNVAVTGAQMLGPGFTLGSTLRYVRASYGSGPGDPAASTGQLLAAAGQLERAGHHRADIDLGLKVGSPSVQGGLVVRNLLQPTLSGPDGREIRLDYRARAGIAVAPWERLTVAADVDLTRAELASGDRRMVAVGAEQWLGDWLGLRGGARFNVEADEVRAVGAFGLSLALTTGLYLDGQITQGADEIERGWSVAGRFGF